MKMHFVGVAVLVAALAVPASAAHATAHLDPLAAAVSARALDGLASSQKKALAKAGKLLAKTTKSASADAAVAAGVAKLLDKAFPGDATFGAALDAAVASFQADAAVDRRSLADLLTALPDGKHAAAGAKQLAKADAALAAADAATTRATELSSLAKAEAAVAKGMKSAAGGESWMVASVDGAPFVSELTQGIIPSGFLSVTGTDYVGRKYLSASRGISLSAGGVTHTGDFALGSQTNYAENPALAGEGVSWSVGGPGATGVVSITRLAGGFVEGTFTFTGRETQTGASTKLVTGGRFRVRYQ
jgi:hypothetical protein